VSTEEEIKQILDHVAKAPFASRPVAVDKPIRGQVFQGRALSAKENSIRAHLAKLVLSDNHWSEHTTAEQYFTDLKTVIWSPGLRRAVYRSIDDQVVLGLFGKHNLPTKRLGKTPKRFLWVVYSTDYGTITTGYQVSGIDEVNVPESARWI